LPIVVDHKHSTVNSLSNSLPFKNQHSLSLFSQTQRKTRERTKKNSPVLCRLGATFWLEEGFVASETPTGGANPFLLIVGLPLALTAAVLVVVRRCPFPPELIAAFFPLPPPKEALIEASSLVSSIESESLSEPSEEEEEESEEA